MIVIRVANIGYPLFIFEMGYLMMDDKKFLTLDRVNIQNVLNFLDDNDIIYNIKVDISTLDDEYLQIVFDQLIQNGVTFIQMNLDDGDKILYLSSVEDLESIIACRLMRVIFKKPYTDSVFKSQELLVPYKELDEEDIEYLLNVMSKSYIETDPFLKKYVKIENKNTFDNFGEDGFCVDLQDIDGGTKITVTLYSDKK